MAGKGEGTGNGVPPCPPPLMRDTILGNPGVTHSVPTAFIMNAVGTEWVRPVLSQMQYVWNGSRLGYHERRGYGMGHAWVITNAVGIE